MNFSINSCRTILETLPIGYYCQRRIEVTLSETEETSFYSPMEDKIVISYPIIAKGLEALPDGANVETAVRSMLYHETSHAILTPPDFMTGYSSAARQAFNIFEDERIETLLADFYKNVDFKAQLRAINGDKPSKPENKQHEFFNLVRYRCGKPEYVKEVERIIKKYASINRAADIYQTRSYQNEIIELYNKLKKDADATKQQAIQIEIQADSAGENNADLKPDALLSDEDINSLIRDAMGNPFGLSHEKRKQADNLAKTLNIMFANFNKKNQGGNGINTYSGVFNPRAVARKDYRYFERAIEANGNNKFGTLHLNLFLDKSGSFRRNQDLTNAIIKTLSDLERKNHNFKLDIYFINHDFYHADTLKDRAMNCNGGNDIPEDMTTIFAKAQKPNTFNYNIFLFDGDALSDADLSLSEKKKRFKLLDRKQTFIISDYDNECYAQNFTAAKLIFTDRYNEELITNLGRAFQTMLA